MYEFAPELYWVYSEEGREYTVDAETRACTCPDARYNNPEGGCKHARRVALWRGDTSAYDSRSEADMALCCLLAFWTGRDGRRVDRLSRPSGRVATRFLDNCSANQCR